MILLYELRLATMSHARKAALPNPDRFTLENQSKTRLEQLDRHHILRKLESIRAAKIINSDCCLVPAATHVAS